MPTDRPNRRWYHLTPDRFFIGLLVVQVFLLLSQRFQWFWFNEHKGWTVLIAVGVVGLTVMVVLVWGLVCLLLQRRFQFSFRSLLVFLLAVGVPLGWFTWESQRARRQREAVEAIRAIGGRVSYGYPRTTLGSALGSVLRSFPDAEPVVLGAPASVSASKTPVYAVASARGAESPVPGWLRKSLGDDFFDDVICVYLSYSRVTDAELEYLEGLTNLEDLTLQNTPITDAELEHLGVLTRLEWLNLRNTHVTDEGVENLQQTLPNCEIVR